MFEATALVFLLAAVGFVWATLGFEYRVEFVTRLAMTLSVPCLIVVALTGTQIDASALALFAFGETGLGYAVVVFTVMPVVTLPLILAFVI